MPNPFMINQANPVPAVQGILGAVQQRDEQQANQQKADAQKQIMGNFFDAVNSDDIATQQALIRQNPMMVEQLQQFNSLNDKQKDSLKNEIASRVLSGGMDQQQVINTFGPAAKSIGMDISMFADMDPEEFKSFMETSYLGSEQHKRWLEGQKVTPTTKEQAETKKIKAETDILEQKFKSLSDPNAPTEDRVKIEKDLRQEVFNRSKDFEKVDDAWRRVKVSAQEPSAAGDMAMIFNYMKMLDPGSTVREGEFATAQQAGSVGDRTISIYNRILDGTRLSPAQRKDFTKRAKSLYGAAQKKQDGLTKKYKGLAKRYNVDYENVVLGVGKQELTDEDLLDKYGV